MQTVLKSGEHEVVIGSGLPFIVIGENINPTGRKTLAEAITRGKYDYIRDLAVRQVASGADMLDVNVGVPGLDEVAVLPQVVKLVAGAVDVPLCLDSANPKALEAALAVAPGKPLVNSVNGEEASLAAVFSGI